MDISCNNNKLYDLERPLFGLTVLFTAWLCSSVGHEPLFYVQSDEELDVSVDEICTDPESRTSAHSDASQVSGLISSLSSHGSPEGAMFDVPGGMPKVGTPDQDENFHETFYTAQTEVPGDADGPVDKKMSLLNVQDEQEGNRSFYFFCIMSTPVTP